MSVSNYSLEFKKSAIQNLIHKEARCTKSISEELGIGNSTHYYCKKDLRKTLKMKTSSRPEDRSPEKKLKIFLEFKACAEEKKRNSTSLSGASRAH